MAAVQEHLEHTSAPRLASLFICGATRHVACKTAHETTSRAPPEPSARYVYGHVTFIAREISCAVFPSSSGGMRQLQAAGGCMLPPRRSRRPRGATERTSKMRRPDLQPHQKAQRSPFRAPSAAAAARVHTKVGQLLAASPQLPLRYAQLGASSQAAMADEAGPSGAGLGTATPEALAEADAKFDRGIQAIRVRSRGCGRPVGLLALV